MNLLSIVDYVYFTSIPSSFISLFKEFEVQ